MKYHARCGKGFDILSNMALHMDKCPKCNEMLEHSKEEYDPMDPRRFKRTVTIGDFEIGVNNLSKAFKNPRGVTQFSRRR